MKSKEIYVGGVKAKKAYLNGVEIYSGGPSNMGGFGNIVSGWEAESIAQAHDTNIVTWNDSYGVVPLTSLDSTKTKLKIVGGKKEVNFNIVSFTAGKPASLDLSGNDDITFVCQLGSELDFVTRDNQCIISWANGNLGSFQYYFNLNLEKTDFAFGADSLPNVWDEIGSPGAIMVGTYKASTKLAEVYINNVLINSGTLANATDYHQTTFDLLVGGRQEIYDRMKGSMRGLWVYNDHFDATKVSEVQTFLTT